MFYRWLHQNIRCVPILLILAQVFCLALPFYWHHTLFYPVPNVDSAIVRIDVNKNKYNFADYNTFKKVAKSAFLMRRKTLVNNLISVFSLTKSDCEKILLSLNFSPMIRGEALSIEDMILLSDAIFRYNNWRLRHVFAHFECAFFLAKNATFFKIGIDNFSCVG